MPTFLAPFKENTTCEVNLGRLVEDALQDSGTLDDLKKSDSRLTLLDPHSIHCI